MKIKLLSPIAIAVVCSFLFHSAKAAEEVGSANVETKEIGEPTVRKYLSADSSGSSSLSVGKSSGNGEPTENNLMIMAGTFANSSTYEWKGAGKRTAVGHDNFGFTYLFENWHDIDVNVRAELTSYQLDDQRPTKLSVLPLFTFPMVETQFPWYVGVGAGPGVFLRQVDGYSPISLDYQFVIGLRFPKIIENTGFVVEAGLKNHLLLLSSGQFNALAVDVGATFAF